MYVSKRSNNKWKGILIAVIAGVLMFSVVGEETKTDSGAAQIFELSQELEAKEAKIEELQKEPTKTKEPTKEAKKPVKKEYTFSSGNYIAGEDFPAGRYDIVAIKGNGNVYSDNSFDAIICLWSAFNEIIKEPDQIKAIKEMKRVSKNNIIITIIKKSKKIPYLKSLLKNYKLLEQEKDLVFIL